MPVYALQDLTQDERLLSIAARLKGLTPGLVLATGQARSGKLTMLAALVLALADPARPVPVLTEKADDFEPFRPAPGNWKGIRVEPNSRAWQAAFAAREVVEAPLVMVSPFSRDNAAALLATKPGQWVLATVDTPLIGLDAAYPLYEMGIDNEAFVERVRCVWSQFLVEKLCAACATPAGLSPAELANLFPADPQLEQVKVEVGCAECEGRGTKNREALCEVLLIAEPTRPAVRSALLAGTPVSLAPEWHVTAQEHARRLVSQGLVGIGTYRQAIRRNPLLRAQNTIEREQTRSFKLDIASRHKSEFLAHMSHELRTPLNAIIGFSDVMLGGMAGPVGDKQREFIGDIRESGRHLLALINDILDLSKIEAGRMELAVTRFDLPLAIGNALALVRERASRHGIRLEANLSPEVAEYDGDERKVKQIVLNLLTNAVKFTPEGGAVTLDASRVDGSYEISVQDTGIGIAADDLDKIFEEFRQVGTDTDRKAEGTGLGLALTRRLIELHGGRIRVASELGRGTTFTVTLPKAEA